MKTTLTDALNVLLDSPRVKEVWTGVLNSADGAESMAAEALMDICRAIAAAIDDEYKRRGEPFGISRMRVMASAMLLLDALLPAFVSACVVEARGYNHPDMKPMFRELIMYVFARRSYSASTAREFEDRCIAAYAMLTSEIGE